MAKRTAITEFLPDPVDLVDIEHDRTASTVTHRVYYAPSDTVADRCYRVVLADGADDDCNCNGFRTHRHCKHVDRCYRFERREWWWRLMADWPDAELVATYATHESHLLADNGGPEDVAAIEAVVLIQTARETQQEAA